MKLGKMLFSAVAALLLCVGSSLPSVAQVASVREVTESKLSPIEARAIMGKNFFGVVDAEMYFAIRPSPEELAIFAQIPFTEKTLESVKDSHILVAVLPMSINDIRGKVKRELFFNHEDPWYKEEQFAKRRGQAGWHLVKKTTPIDSALKAWDEQQQLLGKNEYTPTARIVVYTIIGHYLTEGVRLFDTLFVRCADVDSFGERVFVGGLDPQWLHIDGRLDGNRYPMVGVSSARMLD